MLNIIQGELFKIRKSKILLVEIGIMVALSLFMGSVFTYGYFSHWKDFFDDVSGYTGYMSAFDVDMIFIIIALFVVNMVTNEYAYGSIRQIASRGISRKKFVISQHITQSVVLFILTTVTAVVFAIITTIFAGVGDIHWLRVFIATIGFAALAFGFGGFSMFLAYLIKNSGICIGVNVAIVLGGSIAVNTLQYLTKKEWIGKYWISGLRQSLFDYTAGISNQIQAVIIFFGIGLVFLLATIILFDKRDID